jgi:hypothetical protein
MRALRQEGGLSNDLLQCCTQYCEPASLSAAPTDSRRMFVWIFIEYIILGWTNSPMTGNRHKIFFGWLFQIRLSCSRRGGGCSHAGTRTRRTQKFSFSLGENYAQPPLGGDFRSKLRAPHRGTPLVPSG